MRKITTISVALLLTLALSNGCGPQGARELPDQVSVRLKWLHAVQFAGLYVADQKGFYAEENIEITLNPGGLEHDEVELVASGQDDFAIVEAAHTLVYRGKGRPVVAIAVIYRISPNVYFALRESGIEKPEDFVGKRVVVNPVDIFLPAMMNKLGLGMDQIEAVPPDYDMEALFAGEVDVWNGYLTSQVITAREQGYELNLIYPDHYGIHVYGDSIITTDRMIEEKPELVERFLRATLRGWRYAIENPDEAVAMTLKYEPTLGQAYQKAMMEAQIPLIHTGQDQIGWMQGETWQGMHQMLLNQGILDEPVDVGKAYTMAFLHAIYGREQ